VWRAKNWQEEGWMQMTRKLEESKRALIKWKKTNEGSSEMTIASLTNQLKWLQEIEGEPNLTEIWNIREELHECMEAEDLKWRQRAKETWLE
jgi:hypothetical protein